MIFVFRDRFLPTCVLPNICSRNRFFKTVSANRFPSPHHTHTNLFKIFCHPSRFSQPAAQPHIRAGGRGGAQHSSTAAQQHSSTTEVEGRGRGPSAVYQWLAHGTHGITWITWSPCAKWGSRLALCASQLYLLAFGKPASQRSCIVVVVVVVVAVPWSR